jgi:hypothetical protein
MDNRPLRAYWRYFLLGWGIAVPVLVFIASVD